ncbi:MAG TPA: hypothetical protein VJV74_02495, partial [Terriglobia bacterium]|nr:hypothetical protein [Terriglobia bacterium]
MDRTKLKEPLDADGFFVTGLPFPTQADGAVRLDQLAFGVNTKADLLAIDATNLANATSRKVGTYLDWFDLDKITTRTRIPDVVEPAAGGTGWWWVRRRQPDPSWHLQLSWKVNKDTGSDEALGDTAHPLRTRSEFYRRMGTIALAPGTINVLLDADLASDDTERPSFLSDLSSSTGAAFIKFSGTRRVVFTGTIDVSGGVTTRNGSTSTHTSLTVSGLPSTWTTGDGVTSFMSPAVVITDGTLYSRPVQDSGGKTAWVSPPVSLTNLEGTFTPGAAITIYDVPSLGHDEFCPVGHVEYADLKVSGGRFYSTTGTVFQSNCSGDIIAEASNISSTNGRTGIGTGQTFLAQGCSSSINGGFHRLVVPNGAGCRINVCPTIIAIQIEVGALVITTTQVPGSSQITCDLEFCTPSTLDSIVFNGINGGRLIVAGYTYGSISGTNYGVMMQGLGSQAFFAHIPAISGTNGGSANFQLVGKIYPLSMLAFQSLTDTNDNRIDGANAVWNNKRAPQPGEFWVACVDYDGRVLAGNDNTGSFGIGTDLTSALNAAKLTPFKTLDCVGQAMPRFGNDAICYILEKGRTGGASYLKMDGTTVQDGSWRDAINGWQRWTCRPTGDFSDSAADKIGCGFAIAPGTNAGGYNPTGTPTVNTFSLQLAGGGAAGLPVESGGVSSIGGLRIRFDANTATVALRNLASNVWKNTASQIVVGADLPVAPSTSDVLYVETTELQIGAGSCTIGSNDVTYIVGERWTASTSIRGTGGPLVLSACESTTGSHAVSNFGATACAQNYTDAQGGVNLVGTAGRYVTSGGSAGGFGFTFNESCSFACGTVTGSFGASGCSVLLSSVDNFSSIGIGSHFLCGVNVATGAGSINNGNSSGRANQSIGTLGTPGFQRLRINSTSTVAGMFLCSTAVRVQGVDINNQANNCIVLGGGGVSPRFAYAFDDVVSTEGGNTGTILYMVNTQGTLVEWGRAVANSLTSTGADILFADNAIGTFAGLATTNYRDHWDNNIVGGAGIVVDKPGKLVSITGVPASIGQILKSTGLNSQVQLAQADSSADSSGIVGVAMTPAAANSTLLMATPGTACAILFDTSLPAVGGKAYLSTGTAGEAQSGSPSLVGSNQLVRLGIIVSAAGSFGYGVFRP